MTPRTMSHARSDERRTALWYTPVSGIGGVTRHVLDAVRVGIPGWRVVVLCPEGLLAEQLRDMGAAVRTGPVAPSDGPRAALTAVRRVLRRLRPELLHTHLAYADIIGAAAVTGLTSGRGERIRCVSTEHGIAGTRGYYQSSRARAEITAYAHRGRLYRTDHVIAVSASTREQILAQWGSGAPITVIPNGVDAVDAAPPRPGLRVLSLARLAPEKRVDRLIVAFTRVLQSHPEATLTIAGDGPERDRLRTLAEPLGSAVRFVGTVDAPQALTEHDVVVQLSDWENLSYTLLDAVVRGLGVVATDVGGNAEIVPSQCLVDAKDAAAVAERIARQGLDLAARPTRSEPWTLAQMAERIAGVYEEAGA